MSRVPPCTSFIMTCMTGLHCILGQTHHLPLTQKMEDLSPIDSSLSLSNGSVVPNRLVKVSLNCLCHAEQ